MGPVNVGREELWMVIHLNLEVATRSFEIPGACSLAGQNFPWTFHTLATSVVCRQPGVCIPASP